MFSVLVFFKGMNQRNGTDVDAANAMKVFGKLGYKVKVYNDQSVDQMTQVLTAGKYDSEFIEITQNLYTHTNEYYGSKRLTPFNCCFTY